MPYVKEIFDVVTFEQAKHVVLTSDPDDPKKFEKETNFLVDAIAEQNFIRLTDSSIVFDFGCGMGRIARELINRFKCKVIGLDISESMLMFAKLYTANMNKFQGTTSYSTPESVDVALSVLALQHAENPQKEIDNIVSVLKPGGIFILLNENKRFVPSDVDSQNYIVWNDDGFDIFGYVESKLAEVKRVPYVSGKHDIIFYRKEV